MVKRGEVWLSQLDSTRGREIRKTRPCMIVSPPEIHDFLDVAIVAPMTTGSRPAGFRVPIKFAGKNGLVLLEQIRALDKSRLVRWLGSADSKTLMAALAILREMFGE
ncbi:MAG: type II toxin-antitoxin system PemK/MazF family toxin [Alphaproteobacteria bacterium]|nr:MAG: type II toxin-antitoxin system PemK/MazF family toxin [Alphaproteobacteria bacterium]